jgi:hypothetical protein
MAEITTTPSPASVSSARPVRRRWREIEHTFTSAGLISEKAKERMRERAQPPRFALQHLVEGEWVTLTYADNGPDDPYYNVPMLYHTRYVAESVAKSYHDETVRVHEIGGGA